MNDSSQKQTAYTTAELDRELRQGELLSELYQYQFDPVLREGVETKIPFALVVAQDCDLLQDYNARSEGKSPILNGVLIFEVQSAEIARATLKGQGKGSADWRIISSNQSERYHFLQAIGPETDLTGQGIPSLLVDFRRYFTVQVSEIERQVRERCGAVRRCRLEMPYREHLQARVAFYLQRVGLPFPHET